MGTPTMTNQYVSQADAIKQLRIWPRFTEPGETWVRNTLKRTGECGPHDTVTESNYTAHDVPDHEKPTMLLLRRVARVAGAHVELRRFVARCGTGTVEKRYARVVIHEGTNQSDDDFYVRLDRENRNVRFMLEGGEDRTKGIDR